MAPSNQGEGRSLDGEQVAALRFALGDTSDLVFAAEFAGRVAFLNRAGLARWSEVAIGTLAIALFPEDMRDRYHAAAQSVVAGGAPVHFEWGDAKAWFACTVSPLRAHDVIAGVLCVSSDATELKQVEERLRRSEQLMVDTQGVAHLGMWDWEVERPTVTWTAQLYKIYGLTPETYTPSYEAYLEKVHPDDRARVIEATNRMFHERIPTSHDERVFRPDGSIRYLHTWAHPIVDDAGKLVRLVGVCQDITDRKLAEQAVRQLNVDLERRVTERTHMLENALEDVEAFNLMVSHDLRAPLSVIKLSAEMIVREPSPVLPSRVTDGLSRIRTSVDHMTALVDDLLTLARVVHVPLDRVSIDLTMMSEEVMAEVRRDAPERAAAILIEPGMSCVADRGLMRAVMTNLLSNAWKYSSRVPRAEIEVGRVGVVFFVRDNGAGFDMGQMHRLFAPFERLHRSDEFTGTGVGLTTVHRIIERHGGRVWAESEPGRGATFYFEL